MDDFETLENMISDVKSWKEERAQLEKEQDKLADKLEVLDDDITNTLVAIQNFIKQLTEPEEDIFD